MDINNVEEIKKKIEEEYNENCSKINELNSKIWLLQRSGFERKFIDAVAFSTIPWVVTILNGASILKLGVIPLELTKPLFIAVPALIGTIASSIMYKRQKISEKVKRFSTSKTAKEKLEEETRYIIEQEKLKSYNKMLKKYYNNIESNEKMISTLSEKYIITLKENDTRNKEEIQENIENVEKLFAKSKDNMDISTTRYTLKRLFWRVRDKFDKLNDAFLCGALGSFFSIFFYNIPMIIGNSLVDVQFDTSILRFLAPAIISGVVCASYGFKKTNDRLYVFKKINNELGENAIPDICKSNEKEIFKQEKNKAINNTSVIRMQLDNEKQKLESIKINKEKLMEDLKQENRIEQVNQTLSKPIINNTSEYSDGISQIKITAETGPSLKKVKK